MNGLVGALVYPTDTWYTPCEDCTAGELAHLDDLLAGIQFLARRAQENLERLRQGKPLVGYRLLYVPHQEATALGLTVDHERGLLDPLRAAPQGVTLRHLNRYTCARLPGAPTCRRTTLA